MIIGEVEDFSLPTYSDAGVVCIQFASQLFSRQSLLFSSLVSTDHF